MGAFPFGLGVGISPVRCNDGTMTDTGGTRCSADPGFQRATGFTVAHRLISRFGENIRLSDPVGSGFVLEKFAGMMKSRGCEIAPEPTGHGLPLGKCEAYNRVYDQSCGSS
jgi:hypothetical protein